MKVIYRGFELEAKRKKCLGGWDVTYFTAYKDGWEMICSFSESEDPISEYIKDLKASVDDYYEHPENWEDNNNLNELEILNSCCNSMGTLD